jgi:hypothetical protein
MTMEAPIKEEDEESLVSNPSKAVRLPLKGLTALVSL